MTLKMIYVKTTDTCNLNCSHCFTNGRQGGKVAWQLETTQQWILDFMKQYPSDEQYHLELHGGEPFLVPMFKLWDFVKPFEGLANVSIGATSNLVYKMEPDQIDFIKGPMGGRIGTSWDDGIRFENDKQKELWLKNVRYLKSEGVVIKLFVSVTTGLVNTDPTEFLETMASIGPDEIALERLTHNGNALANPDIFPDNDKQDLWYLAVYKAYKAKAWPFAIGTLDIIQEKIASNTVKVDTNCRNCEQNLVTISANGNLGGCPNAAAEHKHATIDQSAKTFLTSAGRVKEIVKELSPHPLCLTCDVFDSCGGDCHRLAWQGDRCGGLKHLLRYVKSEKARKVFRIAPVK